MEMKLVGYLRKDHKRPHQLKISIDLEAFENAERTDSPDGREFVSLTANLEKVQDVTIGDREITSVCQIIGEE